MLGIYCSQASSKFQVSPIDLALTHLSCLLVCVCFYCTGFLESITSNRVHIYETRVNSAKFQFQFHAIPIPHERRGVA